MPTRQSKSEGVEIDFKIGDAVVFKNGQTTIRGIYAGEDSNYVNVHLNRETWQAMQIQGPWHPSVPFKILKRRGVPCVTIEPTN